MEEYIAKIEDTTLREPPRKKRKNISKSVSLATKDNVLTVEKTKINHQQRVSLEPCGDSDKTQHDWFSPLHHISGGSHTDKLEELKVLGITPETGKWRMEEVHRLHENMKAFLIANEVRDFKRLILPIDSEDRKFRKETMFMVKMCQGIRRTQRMVAARLHMQYTNFLTKGRFSVDEKNQLLQLKKIPGNNWKKIGIIMNRSNVRLHYHHHYYETNWKKGFWSKEEDEALSQVVASFTSSGESISWTNVSKMVVTRSSNACWIRWKKLATKRKIVSNGVESKVKFDESDCHKLVVLIFNSDVVDKCKIDWIDLATRFDSAVTGSWLKWKFGTLCQEVPRYQYLEFEDIISELSVIYEGKSKYRNLKTEEDTRISETNFIT